MRRLTLTREDTAEVSGLWWVFLVAGLLSSVAGILLVTRPSHSLNALAVITGIFLLLDGTIELATSFVRDADKGLAAIVGVLGIVVGIVLIRHPVHGVNAIGILIGIWLVAAGCVRFVRAIVEGLHPLLRCLIAALEVCAGVVIVANPHIGYTTLAIVAGIWLIANGIGLIVFGAAIRTVRSELAAAPPR